MSEIAKLFEKDPLDLTKEDLTTIVAYMREKRIHFQQKQTLAVKKRTKRKLAAPELEGIKVNL